MSKALAFLSATLESRKFTTLLQLINKRSVYKLLKDFMSNRKKTNKAFGFTHISPTFLNTGTLTQMGLSNNLGNKIPSSMY